MGMQLVSRACSWHAVNGQGLSWRAGPAVVSRACTGEQGLQWACSQMLAWQQEVQLSC